MTMKRTTVLFAKVVDTNDVVVLDVRSHAGFKKEGALSTPDRERRLR